MLKFNFRQLIEEISEEYNMAKQDVRNVFEGVTKRFMQLKDVGDKLYIKNIGTFEVIERKEKMTYLNNKKQVIPKRKVIIYKKANNIKRIEE